MAYLLDTGILLRLINVQDNRYVTINQAVRSLVAKQEQLHVTTQNIAEFWNVAIRPVASNGFGWSGEMAMASLTQEIEPVASVLLEARDLPAQLKRLISTYPVTGKQVHDARLAAMMLVWKVDSILTLNDRDFRRYEPEGLRVVTPEMLINTP